MICQVYPAETYRPGELGSFGQAQHMLLRQFQFPDTYQSPPDKMWRAYTDILRGNTHHYRTCFFEHMGCLSHEQVAAERWILEATDERIMAFLVDILQANPEECWTGYRVCASVVGSGRTDWLLALFARHSDTPVYTGQPAPNVLPSPLPPPRTPR